MKPPPAQAAAARAGARRETVVRRALLVAGAAALVLAGLLALPRSRGPAPAAPPPAADEAPGEPVAATPQAAPLRTPATPAGARAPLDFAAVLERLVALGVEVHAALERDELERATRADREAQALCEALQVDVGDFDDRALFALLAADEDVSLPAGRVRRDVCRVLLQRGLQRRQRSTQQGGGRAALDALVTSLLRSVPQSERLARELGLQLLADQPYLGLAHEDPVLDIVAQSHDLQFLRPVACALLLTLWHNLERDRVRTGNELQALALLFKDDRNPVRRLAALQRLLEAQDGRFRELVLDEATRSRDPELARALAAAAAQTLAPRDALAVLERLGPLLGVHAMAPFMVLGQREPAVLRAAYETRLAGDVAPALRAELVTGAAFAGGEQGVAIARLAFEHDTAPEVRVRAMFALTAQAGAALGERTLQAALDDPVLGSEPRHLGQIVLALENLARQGEANAVQRVGQRLRARAALLEEDRRTLETLLEQALPR